MIALAPVLLAASIYVPNQVQNGYGGPDAIPWRTYKNGENSRITFPKQSIINNGGNWQAYWQELTGEPGANAPKDVDFNKEQLVDLHLGLRPTGGYEVYVESIRQTSPDSVTVYYVEATPPLGQRVIQMQTSPYTIVRMPRMPGIVYFSKRTAPGKPGIDWGSDSCHCCCYCTCNGPRVLGYIVTFPDLSGNPFDPLQNIQWRTFDSGNNSKIDKLEYNQIENEATWQSYWAKNTGNPPQTAPKKIDWIKQRAIAINVGSMAGSGGSVYVESVQRKNAANIEITYVVMKPPTEKPSHPAPGVTIIPSSHPYAIITMDRVAGIFTFKRKDIQLQSQGKRPSCRCGCGHCRFER